MVLDMAVVVLFESDHHLYYASHVETSAQVLKRQQSLCMLVEARQDRARWRRRVLSITAALAVRMSWEGGVVDVLG